MIEDPKRWFEQHFPEHVAGMRACEYASRHHLEGDVWTHSSRCLALAREYGMDPVIQWACLLHDLGRLLTRRERKGRIDFGDYEPVSMAMALDVLPFAGLSGDRIIRVLRIIANQYEVMNHIKFGKPPLDRLRHRYRFDLPLLRDLADYARCDMNARIVHPSRAHLYRDEAIVAFRRAVARMVPQPHRPRDLPHRLTLLVGTPCSGKSTLLEQLLGDPPDPRHLVVSRDRCTLRIGALHGRHTYDDAFTLRLDDKTVARQVDLLDDAWERIAEVHPYDVTIDNPNLRDANRRHWIRRKRATHRIRVVVLFKSLDLLFACRRKGKTISRRSFIRRLQKFQLPLLSDGIDELEYRLHCPDTRRARPRPPPSID